MICRPVEDDHDLLPADVEPAACCRHSLEKVGNRCYSVEHTSQTATRRLFCDQSGSNIGHRSTSSDFESLHSRPAVMSPRLIRRSYESVLFSYDALSFSSARSRRITIKKYEHLNTFPPSSLSTTVYVTQNRFLEQFNQQEHHTTIRS